MSKHNYEEIGRAVVLIASLFAGAEYVEAPTKAAKDPKSGAAKTTSSDASANTGGESTGAEAGPPAGNSQNLTAEQFGKLGIEFAARCKDKGAALKAIWSKFKANDGSEKIERGAQVRTEDYDAVLEKIAEADAARELG